MKKLISIFRNDKTFSTIKNCKDFLFSFNWQRDFNYLQAVLAMPYLQVRGPLLQYLKETYYPNVFVFIIKPQ